MFFKAPLSQRAACTPIPHYRCRALSGAFGSRTTPLNGGPKAMMLLVVGLLIFVSSSALCETVDRLKDAQRLLSIGKPGPGAISIKVWTNKEPGEDFASGDRVIVYFQADRDAYLTAISVSSKGGSISVVFPNKDHADTKIEKGRRYTLFGDDSGMRMKLAGRGEKGELVFYVSESSFTLDPLKPAKRTGWISITAGDSEKVKLLLGKLEEIAGTEGFNRVTLSPKDAKGDTLNIKLMGPRRLFKSRKPLQRRLPRDVKSDRPDSVTGVQGEEAEVPLPNAK